MLKQTLTFVVVIFAFIALFVVAEHGFSSSFQACISTDAALGVIIGAYVRCTGEFIHAHVGDITALATLLIAAFTATLPSPLLYG
jgi:hypothetical protein